MSTLVDLPVGTTLVAQWFDSDLPDSRTRALSLWERPDGRRSLVAATRYTPLGVWSVPVYLVHDVTFTQAQAIADLAGLDIDEATARRFEWRPDRAYWLMTGDRRYVVEVPLVTCELEVEASDPYEAIERAREEANTIELTVRPGDLNATYVGPTFTADELDEVEQADTAGEQATP